MFSNAIWSRADKIALFTILFGMLCFFDGCSMGKQKTDKPEEDKPAVTMTNSVSHTSLQKSTNSSPADIEAQLHRIGNEYGIGVSLTNHLIVISMDDMPGVLKQAEDSIHKVLGNDFTNYQITVVLN